MSSRSMSSGRLAKLFGWMGIFCVFAASDSGSNMLGIRPPYEPWTWAYAVPWGIGFLVFGILAKLAAKRSADSLQYEENMKADSTSPNYVQNYILLLRPFSADNAVQVKNPHSSSSVFLPTAYYEESEISIERLLAQAIKPEHRLRVLGGTPIGPGVVKTEDSDWRDMFDTLAEKAKGIVVITLPGKELLWEIFELKRRGLLNRVIFITPPRYSYSHIDESVEDEFYTSLEKNGFKLKKPRSNSILIYRMGQAGDIKEIARTKSLRYKKIRAILEANIVGLSKSEYLLGKQGRLDKSYYIPLQEYAQRTGSLEEELIKRIKEGVIQGYMFDGDWHVHESELSVLNSTEK